MSAAVYPWRLKPKSSHVRSDEVARKCVLPNGAERVEIYGLDGSLHRSEEPDGSQIVFRYGLDGDLRAVEHSSGERVTYDSVSDEKVLRSATDRCETTIEFDENGFPARLVQRVDEFEWIIEYRRDDVGRVTGCLYPQAHEWLESSGHTTRDEARTDVFSRSRSYFSVTVTPHAQQIEFEDGTRTVLTTSTNAELQTIVCSDAEASQTLEMSFETIEGRVTRAGSQEFAYDDAGRLSSCVSPNLDLRYEYDEDGRLRTVACGDQVKQFSYDHVVPIRIDDEVLAYDPLGRRTAHGDATYEYNFFGQLTAAAVGEEIIRYVYDGFGRLVAREHRGERVYYVVDFDGHRIAEANAAGRIQRSYLWQSTNCVAEIDGVIGEPLARSFHRSYGGRLHAIGTNGTINAVTAVDPYGMDQLRTDGVPSFGSLFCDPLAGFYHAGSRWFDPRTAQFLTPDGWVGTDMLNHLPQEMRSVFDALPGGTNIENTPELAYAWCHYDPINYSDPNGHSAVGTGLGLVFSMFSFFLWQMQVTSIAFKLAALNFIVMLIPSLIDLIVSAAKGKPLMGVNIFNAVLPLVGSSRLMVPWAFPLNSLYNAADSVFTMGSVIWMRGSSHRKLNERAKGDILVCGNANTYLAANSVAADVFAVSRSAAIQATGTMNATADLITGTAVVLPAGVPLVDIFFAGDPIGVRPVAGGQEEFGTIVRFIGTDVQLDLALPNSFAGIAVQFFRLDPAIVKVDKDGDTAARTITFIRNTSIHYGQQLPDVFPDNGLHAVEYVFKEKRQTTNCNAKIDFPLLEFSTADFATYNANDFISILSGKTYFGRKVERKHGTKNVILDVALPTGIDVKVEVAVMTASAEPAVNNQASNADKITVGAMRTLRKHNGLAIAVGPGPVVDRRIVLQTFLRCAIVNLDPGLHGIALEVELLLPGVATGHGTVTAADAVTVGKDQAKAFKKKKAVRITNAAGKEFLTLIKDVNTSTETIQLAENLSVDFPVTTAMTIIALETAKKDLVGEPVAAPGGSLEIRSDDLATPVADSLLLIKPKQGAAAPAVRRVNGDPLVVAQLDSAPTNNANLTVTAFFADRAKTHKGEAKKVILRLTPTTPPHPFAVNDEIYSKVDREEYVGKIIAAAPGELILEDPIIEPAFIKAGTFDVQLVTPTGQNTPDASLDASLVAIPSDPDEDPVSRSRATELHEMRHVWQYAVVGPFFFSQPLPLLRLLTPEFFDKHKWMRFVSLKGVDALFSLVGLGISAGLGLKGEDTSLNGTVADAERKRITFDAAVSTDRVADFADGVLISVATDSQSTENIVSEVVKDERRIELRFPLEEAFPQNTAVRVSVGPFEKLNSELNGVFNLSKLWEPLLPQSWTHVLRGFMNSENWFPLLGLYPIALARGGFDQSRMYFEQDASFQSGDIYTAFGVAYPHEIFVGEYSRVLSFIIDRSTDPASGLSDLGSQITRALTIEPKVVPGGKAARDLVLGSTSAGGNLVRFRKEFMIPMNDKVENTMGAMFLSTTPGDYRVLAFDEWRGQDFSLDNMVDPAIWLPPFIPFFPTNFNDLRLIKVKPLEVKKQFTAADPLFETEATTFTVKGADHVAYTIEYKGAPPVPPGVIAGLTFTAPQVGAQLTHHLQIVATYQANHDIFKAKGKLHGPINLPAATLRNVCQDLDVVIAPIVVDAVAPVKAGKSVEFKVSIPPTTITRFGGNIPEATVQASLDKLGGRPCRMLFRAPDKVNAQQDVHFNLNFGAKVIPITITVQP